jgi:hypothetical protein
MQDFSWLNDWAAFVASVCRDWNAGLPDEEVTRRHAFQKVRWIGVAEKSNETNDGRLLAIDMPTIHFELRDGRVGFAGRVLLHIEIDSLSDWDGVREGDRIRFETEITMPCDNPFISYGIEWADIGNRKGYVTVSTRNSRLLDVLREV